MENIEITKDLKDCIFEELKNLHNYWGENNFPDMIDFCNRNKLSKEKELLTILMKPERIKRN